MQAFTTQTNVITDFPFYERSSSKRFTTKIIPGKVFPFSGTSDLLFMLQMHMQHIYERNSLYGFCDLGAEQKFVWIFLTYYTIS